MLVGLIRVFIACFLALLLAFFLCWVPDASGCLGHRLLVCLLLFGLGGSGLRCGCFSTLGTRVLGAVPGLFLGLADQGLGARCLRVPGARVLGAAFARFLSTFWQMFGLGGPGPGCQMLQGALACLLALFRPPFSSKISGAQNKIEINF